jgi:hypothetical protein
VTIKRRVLARRLGTILTVIALATLGLYALWPWLPIPGRGARPRTVIFYGFSILGEVMNQAIFPAFQKQWEGQTGERVEFISSFAGSGTVTNHSNSRPRSMQQFQRTAIAQIGLGCGQQYPFAPEWERAMSS